ncbi:metallophosphoesterase family protein [Actinomadura rupiterrae]|uniref:metallophosphoesterase family protein n=1 Tax=Actinomadura rupiterrae TaxID=559627 RepID=UPI0020A4635A|nr:metallophosphoesterase [Actinomadura rupiterrae]
MNRRQLIKHGAWFGAAVALAVAGGEVVSRVVDADAPDPFPKDATLRFVQVSDSHIGFTGPANTDVAGSFHRAVKQVNALKHRPDFVLHSGDLTHLATPAQFDHVKQMTSELKAGRVVFVPGEHDSIDDAGQKYRAAFGKGTVGDGWYSFDLQGVHFIGLVNTLNLKKLGHLGEDQIAWVQRDIAGLHSDTPIVVFSHIPLFALYPAWGWGTDDAARVLQMLARFSSVTCLNGHIHQLFTKTEGNVTFHSATTTAYPLPKPGQGPAPAPVTLPAGKLQDALGIREVGYVRGRAGLAVRDQKLA